MKRFAVRWIVVALAVMAVASASPVLKAGEQVPIKGDFVTLYEADQTAFPVVKLVVEGVSQMSHLGRTACYTDNEVVVFSWPPVDGRVSGPMTGTLKFTAANKDQLVGQMEGVLAELDLMTGVVSFAGTLRFEGGTGRFANATGSATIVGGATPDGAGWFSIRGNVSSPGASKK